MKISVLGRKKLNKIYNTVIIRDVHLSAGVGSIVYYFNITQEVSTYSFIMFTKAIN